MLQIETKENKNMKMMGISAQDFEGRLIPCWQAAGEIGIFEMV